MDAKNNTQQVVSVPGGPESGSVSGWVGVVTDGSTASITQTSVGSLFQKRKLPDNLAEKPGLKPKR